MNKFVSLSSKDDVLYVSVDDRDVIWILGHEIVVFPSSHSRIEKFNGQTDTMEFCSVKTLLIPFELVFLTRLFVVGSFDAS